MEPAGTTSPISVLPNDILLYIFKILLDRPWEHKLQPNGFFDRYHKARARHVPHQCLSSFVNAIPLVNRAWHLLSRRVLYNDIELPTGARFSAFLNTVRQEPELGRCITTLVVTVQIRQDVTHGEDRSCLNHHSEEGGQNESIDSTGQAGSNNIHNAEGDDLDAEQSTHLNEQHDEDEEESVDSTDQDDSWEEPESISEATLFDLLQLLPDLRHLCIKALEGSGFTVELSHLRLFPADLDLLCLHHFHTCNNVLSALPDSLDHLSLDWCQLSKERQSLDLPELRSFQWIGSSKFGDWTINTFERCTRLTNLSLYIALDHQDDAIRTALQPLLPRVEQLTLYSSGRRTSIDSWFRKNLSGLKHLSVNGDLTHEELQSLPQSIRSFIWTNAGRNHSQTVNTFLSLLPKSQFLPNLLALPHAHVGGWAFAPYDQPINLVLVQEALRSLATSRA